MTRIDLLEAPKFLRTDALFSGCLRYRYTLLRVWDYTRARCNFVMLNPSTADARHDDPTVRRCIGFAKQWGFGSLSVTNLFALRSPDPRTLRDAEQPVGYSNYNDLMIRVTAKQSHAVVCAWGNHGNLFGRSSVVRELLRPYAAKAFCLAITQSGEPVHPLYQRADIQPGRLFS